MLKEFLEKHKQVVLCGNVAKSSEEIKKVIKQWRYEDLEQKGLEVKGEIEEMRAKKFYGICKLIGAPFTNATQKAKDFPVVWDVIQLDGEGGIKEYWRAGFVKLIDCAKKYEDKKFVAIFEGIDIKSVKRVLSKMFYMLVNRGDAVNVRGEETQFFIPSNLYFIAVFRDDESKLSEWERGVIEEIGRFEVR